MGVRKLDSEEPRERLMAAALGAAGELGYRNVSAATVERRAGESEGELERRFGSFAECFTAAYAAEAERLVGRLLAAAAPQPSWRRGLRAALDELAAYVVEDPRLARALLIEVHVAGPPATDRRAELVERLATAIDRGRQGDADGDAPPPLTAAFMAGAIESAIVSALVNERPETFAGAVPELEQLIAAAYEHPHT